jgi:predicted MPP superfamily phosphohydrolase
LAIFFAIVLSIYFASNYYVFIRGWQAIPAGSPLRTIYLIIFLFLSLSYFLGRILESVRISPISDFLLSVGSFWLAAMLYFFLALLVLDIIRLFNSFFHFLPEIIYKNYPLTKLYMLGFLIIAVSITVLLGHLNAISPKLKKYELTIDKKAGNLKELNILMASDTHLGTLIRKDRMQKLVDASHELNPDIILLAGDVIDEDVKPVIHNGIGDIFYKMKSKYGIYAITGNHEYIGGVNAASEYLVKHGINLLRDSTVLIDSSFYVVGREDLSIKRMMKKDRAELKDLLKNVNKDLPVIMMDHQPFHLEEAEQNGIDLQLSGHTHHGQLWPFNFITKAVYEVSWGYKKKGNSHIYVSSGYGLWGPQVRTGSDAEYLFIKLKFK